MLSYSRTISARHGMKQPSPISYTTVCFITFQPKGKKRYRIKTCRQYYDWHIYNVRYIL